MADVHIGKTPDRVVEHANEPGVDLVDDHACTGRSEGCRNKLGD